MTPRELAVRWREDADTLERRRASELAQLLRDCAEELERALRDADAETLTLADAAAQSGYSIERLRHMVAPEGESPTPAQPIPNAGKRGAPRIRRGDLPVKRTPKATGFDAATAARDLLADARTRTPTEGRSGQRGAIAGHSSE